MKTNPYKLISGRVHRSWSHNFLLGAALLLFLLLIGNDAFAGSATWARFPQSGNWGFPGNWSPQTVPNGPSDTATFVRSNDANVLLSQSTEVNAIVFNSAGIFGSTAFTITIPNSPITARIWLVISGAGITNNSGLTQTFVTSPGSNQSADVIFGVIFFNNSASAGASTAFINSGATGGTPVDVSGGVIEFGGTSVAGSAMFINNGGDKLGGGGGLTQFTDSSNAGSATLIANPGTNNGEGGVIRFNADSTGGTSRIEVFGSGSLQINFHHAPGITIGSIEGNGTVLLGANNLTVGSSNKSTVFSGLIDGSGGSLTKIGNGKLTLNFASTYTGGTTINKGTLLVKNPTGSATGSGAVQVNAGTLEGVGKIDGAVTVGTGVGTTSKANLLAGNGATSPGTLTVNNSVTFQSDSTYKCVLNRNTGKASKLTASGVSINNSAQFAFTEIGSGTLTVGTVFTVIDNTSNLPISGRFRNLSNGLILTSSDGTKFKVSYAGGTGNDLTLKVVP